MRIQNPKRSGSRRYACITISQEILSCTKELLRICHARSLNVMFSAVHLVGQVHVALLPAMLQAMSSMTSVNMWSSVQSRVKFSHILDVQFWGQDRSAAILPTSELRSILPSRSFQTVRCVRLVTATCCTRILTPPFVVLQTEWATGTLALWAWCL